MCFSLLRWSRLILSPERCLYVFIWYDVQNDDQCVYRLPSGTIGLLSVLILFKTHHECKIVLMGLSAPSSILFGKYEYAGSTCSLATVYLYFSQAGIAMKCPYTYYVLNETTLNMSGVYILRKYIYPQDGFRKIEFLQIILKACILHKWLRCVILIWICFNQMPKFRKTVGIR